MVKLSESKKKNILIRLLANRILFALHLFAYCAVMGLLILIWAITGAGFFWPFFAIFGWGFGMGFHALIYLMYNDIFHFLTKIRQDPAFRVLFIFHAWFYSSVNIFLIIINISLIPAIIFFIWPLLFWGIAFGFHALGFFLWESSIGREMTNLQRKYPDSEMRKLKMMATSKISNFWLVIIHVGYYLIVNIFIYTGIILVRTDISELIEMSLWWASLLGVHIFSFLLFFFVESLKYVVKGVFIHLAFYGTSNAWMLYQYSKDPLN
ncbi:MAG: 2TM domain-containing protein, partial [Promethearchaeota archaeon]